MQVVERQTGWSVKNGNEFLRSLSSQGQSRHVDRWFDLNIHALQIWVQIASGDRNNQITHILSASGRFRVCSSLRTIEIFSQNLSTLSTERRRLTIFGNLIISIRENCRQKFHIFRMSSVFLGYWWWWWFSLVEIKISFETHRLHHQTQTSTNWIKKISRSARVNSIRRTFTMVKGEKCWREILAFVTVSAVHKRDRRSTSKSHTDFMHKIDRKS